MTHQTSAAKPPVSTWTVIKKKLKRMLYYTGLFLIIFLGALMYWKYFYTYSEGSRVGLLQKFSRKGTIFKTYEGEMILSSVASGSNVVLASEKFLFSVTGKNLAKSLDSLQGRTIVVYYRQKNKALIWKGDTPYYVDSVRMR